MPSTADKLFPFLSEQDYETVLRLAKQEIGTTTYSNWNDDKLSQDQLLVCEYVDKQFAKLNSHGDEALDDSFCKGWDDGITVAIDSEIAWEAYGFGNDDEDCPPTVGDLREQVETELDSLQRGVVFGEKQSVYKSEVRFLEGKKDCLVRICTNWPEDSTGMADVLIKFQRDSQRWHEEGGRWNGFKLKVRKKKPETEQPKEESAKAEQPKEESPTLSMNTKKRRDSIDELYHVPGFIDEVMQLSLKNAPYPSRPLAFGGAISLMSLLTGRRVTFQGLASNLYILALATSSSGKDYPRKVNVKLLHDAGIGGIGDSFASGEGLEDAMHEDSQMLFQVDEFDTIVKSMSDGKEARFASITQSLLKFYTSSSSTYFLRRKAGDESQKTIVKPHLSLFATCVPSSLLDSVSAKMLTNGLLARMVVIEAGQRGFGRRSKSIDNIDVSESIQEQVTFWKDFGCDGGNLSQFNPKVQELEATEKALSILDEFRTYCDLQYDNRYKSHDEGGCAIWGRANELAIKLSLIYTCSATPLELVIDCEAVKWATSFARHHVERMISLARDGVSESPFDKLCNKLIDRVASSVDGVPHADLLRFSKVDSKQFRLAIETLSQRGQIEAAKAKAKNGKEHFVYVLS